MFYGTGLGPQGTLGSVSADAEGYSAVNPSQKFSITDLHNSAGECDTVSLSIPGFGFGGGLFSARNIAQGTLFKWVTVSGFAAGGVGLGAAIVRGSWHCLKLKPLNKEVAQLAYKYP